MEWTFIAVIVAIINDVASISAVIIGGIWIYTNYIRNRAGKWNLNIDIDAQQEKTISGKKLLIINVALKNLGSVKVIPGANGCVVTVQTISLENKNENYIKPEDGPVIYNADILQKYKRADGYSNYIIEPGSKYNEIACISLNEDADILMVTVEFFWKNNEDSIIESKIINVRTV